MSGTSLDGIDTIMIDLSDQAKIIGTHYQPYNDLLRQKLRRLATGCNDELTLYASLDTELGILFANTINQLIDKTEIAREDIRAIGSHGQTVRHLPDKIFPNSLQIGNPNIIAEHTGITTVADFRRRDIAAHGQGAPLVPAFHQAIFSHHEHYRAIVNIGGIANVTFLPPTINPAEMVIGFDIGPGNTLMDTWIYRHKGEKHDQNGNWGETGTCNQGLLNALIADPYFSTPPPKSTGPEYFNLVWLENYINQHPDIPVNIQATLCELTSISISNVISAFDTHPSEVFICGGGSHNNYLMQQLSNKIPDSKVRTTSDIGIDPDWVEAAAFAWLAQRTLNGLPANLPAVTGATNPVILGGIYQA